MNHAPVHHLILKETHGNGKTKEFAIDFITLTKISSSIIAHRAYVIFDYMSHNIIFVRT